MTITKALLSVRVNAHCGSLALILAFGCGSGASAGRTVPSAAGSSAPEVASSGAAELPAGTDTPPLPELCPVANSAVAHSADAEVRIQLHVVVHAAVFRFAGSDGTNEVAQNEDELTHLVRGRRRIELGELSSVFVYADGGTPARVQRALALVRSSYPDAQGCLPGDDLPRERELRQQTYAATSAELLEFLADLDDDVALAQQAARELGRRHDPATVAPLLDALFAFPEGHPEIRLNNAASTALAVIGAPAIAPLSAALREAPASALAAARRWLTAVRQRAPEAAAGLSEQAIVRGEVAITLGIIGDESAFAPMMATARSHPEETSLLSGAAMLWSTLDGPQRASFLAAWARSFDAVRTNPNARLHLITMLASTRDDQAISQLLDALDPGDERILPDAYLTIIQVCDRAEAIRATSIARQSERFSMLEEFTADGVALTERCDRDLACWVEATRTMDEGQATHAAVMLGRFGAGDPSAISALLALLDHPYVFVSRAALDSLNHLLPDGDLAVAAAIDERGRGATWQPSWRELEANATTTAARLRRR